MSSATSPSRRGRSASPLSLALAAGALAAVAACGGASDPASPAAAPALQAQQISQDVAGSAADATLTLTDTQTGSEQASGSYSRAGVDGPLLDVAAAPPTTTCTGPDASGWFTCARVEDNGMGVTRSWRYWSGGRPAPSYTATTDSVNHRWTIAGTRIGTDSSRGETRTVTAHRADTSTVVIVRGATPAPAERRVWSGVGVRNDTTTVTASAGTRRYVEAVADTVRGVTYGLPRASYPYPLSGTVAHSVRTTATAASGASTTTTRRALVTFNGTQTATIQIGGLTCPLDLRTRKVGTCQ